MHNVDLILTLSAGLIGALTLGYITHRLGWSPIVGYLLAGVLLGPHTPGFVADRQLADQMAEIGVILLMFGVGLHFHLKDLMSVRTIAVAGALCQSTVATVLGALACVALGWSWAAGIVFGMALSVASTVVLTRVLGDNNQLHSPTGRIAIGWLIVEDILTVFVLVLLPVVFGTSVAGSAISLPLAVTLATAKLVIFAALILIAGARLIPWVLGKIAATHSRELFTLGVLAIALGIAVGSAHFFGVSMALGAFLAGVVVGQSDFSARAGSEALPMRDAFAVMFFLSVGMLLEPQQILAHPLLTAATFAVVLVAKPLAAFTIVVLLGYGTRIGLGVAIALAQIGEFSFLLAVLGRDLGVLPEAMINPLVTTAIASIILNPFLYRSLPSIEKFVMKNRFSAPANLPALDAGTPVAHRAIVVGYGPVGQTVTRLLLRRGIEPTIIEMNIETFRNLQNAGVRVVYGDANQKEVLNQAGAGSAASVIFSASGSGRMAEAFRRARQLNPAIQLVVRADYVAETPSLLKAGVNEVISDDGEVALALTTSILKKFGATPEQLAEEHERTRKEMQESLTPD